MTIQESVSNSNYNGMWLSAEKRFAKGLTFNASYTFSKSIDNNSVGSSNPQIQNFYNIAAERALSDFDARQRFVLSGIYLLPFHWEQNGFTRRLVGGLEHLADRQPADRAIRSARSCRPPTRAAWRRSIVPTSLPASR